MTPFLKQVAAHLYKKHGADLHRISVVFPNRRSRVFFNAYLNEVIDHPVLGPEVITINDLVSRLSGLQLSDQFALVIRLHEIYQHKTGHVESLDDFYFWGETLLSDFNDIDSYLLDARDLFRNIADLKEIESRFDYLTEPQKKAIETFWGNLGKAADSANRERFMEIWNKLPEVYRLFKESLLEDGLVYSGLLYRDVAEQLPDLVDSLQPDGYVFVGFNALNACEKKIFSILGKAELATFYWDYDPYFVDDTGNEAGMFIRENLVQFPSPEDFQLNSSSPAGRNIKVVSVPGQVAQSQIVNHNELLGELEKEHRFDDIALVLAEEGLLVPVVSAAGNRFDAINITMGYPFQDTPVYSLILLLVELQKNSRMMDGRLVFYHRPVLALLNHELITGDECSQLVSNIHSLNKIYIAAGDLQANLLSRLIFQRYTDWSSFSAFLLELMKELASHFEVSEDTPVSLEAEYSSHAYLTIQRLEGVLAKFAQKDVSLALYFRILIQQLQRISIPFEGEPLSGLQVMGVLETRNLDFKKIVIFSVNEGQLPRLSVIHSFIPYHLRKAFGLPSYEEHDAMNAYYFYRLIHRAEDVVLVYNSSSDGLNSGEMSRYLLQLKYDSDFKVDEYHLNFNFKGASPSPISVRANKHHQASLLQRYSDKRLSPSALNTYLDCKLRFYFQHIVAIRHKEELFEDVDPRLFGNLFHFAAEKLYEDFSGTEMTSKHLEALILNKKKIEECILFAFKKEYYKDKELRDIRLTGNNILIAEHLKTYLGQMLKNDREIAPFRIVALEGEYEAEFSFELNGKVHKIRIGGIVDRIDEANNVVRIIDYKTGRNLKLDYKSMDQLFDRSFKDRRKEIMQAFIYSEIFLRRKPGVLIKPSIYKIDNFFDDDFSSDIIHQKGSVVYNDISFDFKEDLQNLLVEVFSDTNTYNQTEDARKCTHCPFDKICRRT